jgi:hypothetical protein
MELVATWTLFLLFVAIGISKYKALGRVSTIKTSPNMVEKSNLFKMSVTAGCWNKWFSARPGDV